MVVLVIYCYLKHYLKIIFYYQQATGECMKADAVSKSLQLTHVRLDSGSSVGAYFCEICQAPLSGKAPLQEHVNSPNHAKKLRNKEGAFDIPLIKVSFLFILDSFPLN